MILSSLFSCALWPNPQAGEATHAAGDAECHEQHDEQQSVAQPVAQQPDAARRRTAAGQCHRTYLQGRRPHPLLLSIQPVRLQLWTWTHRGHGHQPQLGLTQRIRQRGGGGDWLSDQGPPGDLHVQPGAEQPDSWGPAPWNLPEQRPCQKHH